MLFDLKKGFENQAVQSGFRVLKTPRYAMIAIAVFACLLLVGSYGNFAKSNVYAHMSDPTLDFSEFSKGELVRYAYDLQGVIADSPEDLYKISAQDLRLMLAEPDLERQDFPSVAWQYRSESCVLDVYYTASDADGLEQAQIQHFEIRSRDLITADASEGVEEWNCMQSLYQERQKIIEASFEDIFADAQERAQDNAS